MPLDRRLLQRMKATSFLGTLFVALADFDNKSDINKLMKASYWSSNYHSMLQQVLMNVPEASNFLTGSKCDLPSFPTKARPSLVFSKAKFEQAVHIINRHLERQSDRGIPWVDGIA